MSQTIIKPVAPETSHEKRAVIYLRVSSDQQVERGYGDEGYSVPAQREACTRKAAELGATVVAEYVDLAKSAKTKNRPRFMEMIADIERDRDIDYVVVHKLNRFARKAMDDSVIDYRLSEAGAQLASVLEHIDATPSGKLNHRIHAAFAEYENENLAAEIRKGQIQKHLAGGTPFTAPVGYKHSPVEFEGRLINSIVIDKDRAPLVQLAFDLYDTGEYPITRLRDTLEEHGLTSRPSRRRTSKPLSRNGLHTMLRNPYYIGIVVYMGKRVQGRHPKLVDERVFDRVQARLEAQRAAGDRPRKHQHYLKGSLTCDQCGARLIYGQHTGGGGVYEYFSCVRRRARNGGKCDTGHYRVEPSSSRSPPSTGLSSCLGSRSTRYAGTSPPSRRSTPRPSDKPPLGIAAAYRRSKTNRRSSSNCTTRVPSPRTSCDARLSASKPRSARSGSFSALPRCSWPTSLAPLPTH